MLGISIVHVQHVWVCSEGLTSDRYAEMVMHVSKQARPYLCLWLGARCPVRGAI
jgi:hypothetical protein